jgi:hypothetical protein
MSEHTPGPWGIERGSSCYIVSRSAHMSADVAIVITRPSETQEADACLIAAAPDLLVALKSLYALVKGEVPSLLEDNVNGERALTVITKAEGK